MAVPRPPRPSSQVHRRIEMTTVSKHLQVKKRSKQLVQVCKAMLTKDSGDFYKGSWQRVKVKKYKRQLQFFIKAVR